MNRLPPFGFAPLAVIALTGSLSILAQPSATDSSWPRHFSNGEAGLTVYQPQIDGWSDFKTLRGRCAVALQPKRGAVTVYGTLRFEASTLVDANQRLVLLRDIRTFDMRFPQSRSGASSQWSALIETLLPKDALVLSLDRILAYMRAGEVPRQEAKVRSEPPKILFSDRPAVLVIVDGDPVFLDIENTSLTRVVNTNWDLYRHNKTQAYFLRVDSNWLAAPGLDGPYAQATDLPADLAKLPPSETNPATKDASQAYLARFRSTPRVFVVNHPAELIAANGAPEMSLAVGGELSFVANTESDLFFHSGTKSYYFLTSGRWFRAATLAGPWQYASTSLPPEFKAIPSTHPKAHVLASVPGTREAEDAILLAAIPRTAEVNRSAATAEVQYVGAPEFVPISGTAVSYARNTPSDVLRIGDSYYLCHQGVWFVSRSASGPWVAADKVPQEIYSIPESSPKYNVTYVRVYSSTPSTVVVGYTPGYYGAYVSGGVVVWGTGYYYPPYVAVGVSAVPVYWASPCYTYGASAWYNPATGVYARGGAAYGPYGGYGGGAAYNPRTGTYAQGGAAWSPGGGVAAARTYNPSTGTYSAGYNAANPYGRWGEGVVSNGNDWARGGYQATSRGAVAAGETSQGGKGVAAAGPGGNAGYVGKSGSGDVYAGANGNVYKRENGQWYQNQNGAWSAMDKSQVSAQHQQAAAARERGSVNAQAAERWRANPQAGNRNAGSGRRPQFSGGRR